MALQNIKAVVFDLDGTLLDTINDIAFSLNDMLWHFGYRTLDRKSVIGLINHGAKALVKNSFPERISQEKFDQAYDYYFNSYAKNPCDKTVLYDGIGEILLDCKSAGYKVGVCTNKQAGKTLQLCKNKFNGFNFDFIIGVEEGIAPKPDPTAILNKLAELGINPNEAVMVGDGDTDVKTAINAKMQSVAVLWGYRDRERLESVGATVFAKDCKQLKELLIG